MTMNIEQKLQELEDRNSIRELIDQYAFCADTRDAQGQMAIFTMDTIFEVYMDEKIPTPTQVLIGRENLFPVFDDLNQYQSTMHLNAQSTIKVNGDQASATTYCRAYHLKVDAGVQKLMIAGIRYFDKMVRQDGAWLFSERKLKVCWIETR
jgi:SnoaL-like domain